MSGTGRAPLWAPLEEARVEGSRRWCCGARGGTGSWWGGIARSTGRQTGQRPRATPVSLLMGCTHHVAVRLYVAVWPPMASMVQLLADCDIYMVMSLHCCGLCDALVLVRVCRLSVRVYDSQRGCRARSFI